MRIQRRLPMCSIRVDRTPIGPATLALVDFLRQGGTVPPIHVKSSCDGLWDVLDGRHRALAFKLLGRTEIEVRYGHTVSDDVINDLLPSYTKSTGA